MELNFFVRFHLEKCGASLPEDDTATLAALAGIGEEEVQNNLGRIDEMLGECVRLLNEKGVLPPDPLRGRRILFLGDSNTSDRLSYMNILRKATEAEIIDGAISGAYSTTFVPMVDDLLDRSAPDTVHLMLGSNDVPVIGKDTPRNVVKQEVFADNIEFLLQRIGSGRKIVLSLIPPYNEEVADQWFCPKLFRNETVGQYNAVLRALADRYGCTVNDTHRFIFAGNDKFYRKDGVHLSPFAHTAFAEHLIKLL